MGKRDEMVSWLEKLGVTGLRASEEEANDKADADPPPSGKRGKLMFEPPIGELELLSLSRADKQGRVFDVTISDSDKVPLFFEAARTGKSLGTATISVGGMEITLQDVQISSIQMSGSTAQIRLDSSKPAEIRRESD